MVGEVERSVLTAPVAVMDEFGVRLSSGHGHGHCFDDQFTGLTVAHRPGDEPTATKVLHAGQEELALPGRELGDIGHPALIGPAGREVTLQEVTGRGHLQWATAPLPAGMDTHQVFLGHQPGHPLASDPGSHPSQLAMDPRCPIGAPRTLVDLPDGVGQIAVLETPRGGRLVGPGVVTAAGDLGGPAQCRDRVPVPVGGDEPIVA